MQLFALGAIFALFVVRFSSVFAFLQKLWTLLLPLILGIVFAYLVDIPARKLEHLFSRTPKHRNAARVFAVLISLLFFLVVITGVLVLLLPQLGLAVRQFTANLPVLYAQTTDSLDHFLEKQPQLEQGFALVEEYVNSVVQQIMDSSDSFADYAVSLVGGAINGVVNTLLALIFSLYLLLGKQRLLNQLSYILKRFLAPQKYEKLIHVIRVSNRTFAKFFTGQFFEALILGSLCTIGMLILRFPYALTVGSVVGMTAIIPLVGAYIGGTVGFVLIFGQSLRLALFFLLFLVLLQQMEGNLIYPRVVGTSVGLPGVWVFVAVILGAGLFGVPGVLFGVPLAATIYQLLKENKQ